MTANLPVVVSDGAKDWQALDKWSDFGYVSELFGERTIYIWRITKST